MNYLCCMFGDGRYRPFRNFPFESSHHTVPDFPCTQNINSLPRSCFSFHFHLGDKAPGFRSEDALLNLIVVLLDFSRSYVFSLVFFFKSAHYKEEFCNSDHFQLPQLCYASMCHLPFPPSISFLMSLQQISCSHQLISHLFQ